MKKTDFLIGALVMVSLFGITKDIIALIIIVVLISKKHSIHK